MKADPEHKRRLLSISITFQKERDEKCKYSGKTTGGTLLNLDVTCLTIVGALL